MDRLVSSFVGPYGPGASGVTFAGYEHVVLPLSPGTTYGVDGRQVEHIEAEPRDIGQERLAVPKRSVGPGFPGGRAGKQLVPGAEARLLPLNNDGELFAVEGFVVPLSAGPHYVEGFLASDSLEDPFQIVSLPQQTRQLGKLPRLLGGGSFRNLYNVGSPDGKFHGKILSCPVFLFQPLEPGKVHVHVTADPIAVPPQFQRDERTFPAVIADVPHRHLAPAFLIFPSILEDRCNDVVPLGENISFDSHFLSRDALDRVPSPVDLGLDSLDNDSVPSFHVHRMQPCLCHLM